MNEDQGYVHVEGNNLNGEDDELYPILKDVSECGDCGHYHGEDDDCTILQSTEGLK